MTTVSEIIDALGGTTKVAEMFGVKPSAVSNWRAFGRFPERLHLRVYRECRVRRIKLPDGIFDTQGEAA